MGSSNTGGKWGCSKLAGREAHITLAGSRATLTLAGRWAAGVRFDDLLRGAWQHHLNELLEVDAAVLVPVRLGEHQCKFPAK